MVFVSAWSPESEALESKVALETPDHGLLSVWVDGRNTTEEGQMATDSKDEQKQLIR